MKKEITIYLCWRTTVEHRMGRQSKCKVPEETTACSPARLVLAVFRQEIGRGLEEGLVSDKRPIFLLALE
jgi:hypothetical protein